MKKQRKDEWIEMEYGLILIGFILVFMGGYYIHAVNIDYQNQCRDCVTQDCMDYDLVCGDFGIYWVKLFILVCISIFGSTLVLRHSSGHFKKLIER